MKRVLLSLGACANLLSAPVETIVQQEEAALIAASDLPKSISEIPLPPPSFEAPYKNPFLAVGLSFLFPGLGHIYLEDRRTAQGLIASSSIECCGLAPRALPWVNNTSGTMLQNTWFYGVYASYRDVRAYNGNRGYLYKMPTDSLSELAYAPFSFATMKKPEVWGALLVQLAAAVGIGYLWDAVDTPTSLSKSIDQPPIIALPIAIGEESFFRGYIQPVCSEVLTPTGGIAASSLLFGAAHLLNAYGMPHEYRKKYYSLAIPLITASGFYDGYLSQKNHSLKETVALHAWYDFILFSISFLAADAEEALSQPESFTVTIPF